MHKLSQVVCGKLDSRFYGKNKIPQKLISFPDSFFGMRT